MLVDLGCALSFVCFPPCPPLPLSPPCTWCPSSWTAAQYGAGPGNGGGGCAAGGHLAVFHGSLRCSIPSTWLLRGNTLTWYWYSIVRSSNGLRRARYPHRPGLWERPGHWWYQSLQHFFGVVLNTFEFTNRYNGLVYFTSSCAHFSPTLRFNQDQILLQVCAHSFVCFPSVLPSLFLLPRTWCPSS